MKCRVVFYEHGTVIQANSYKLLGKELVQLLKHILPWCCQVLLPMDMEISSVIYCRDKNYRNCIITITGLLQLASCSPMALFNHILHYGGITKYPCRLPIFFAPGDAVFHYSVSVTPYSLNSYWLSLWSCQSL